MRRSWKKKVLVALLVLLILTLSCCVWSFLIELLGDYMSPNSWHSHRVEPEVTAAALKNLKCPLGVYSVLGNHDWWYNGERVRRALEQNGIHVLEDEAAEIKWHDKSFWLVGLADL